MLGPGGEHQSSQHGGVSVDALVLALASVGGEH